MNEPSHELIEAETRRDRPSLKTAAGVFVWSVWAAMSIALLWFVWHSTPRFPQKDEWAVVPYLTGEAPITWEWLWQPHNEHRIPLAKLLMIDLGPLTEDFSLLAYIDAFLLIATAGGILFVLGRGRGWHVADATIPMLLLHWGHWENLNWGFQFSFVFFTVLACWLLLAVVGSRSGLSGCRAVLFSIGLLLLPLLGAQGVVFVPFLAVWLFWAGVRNCKHGSKIPGLAMVLCAGLAMGLAGLYCLALTKPAYHPDCPGSREFARACLEFLVAGWGTMCHRFKRLEACLTLLGYVVFGAALIRAWWLRSERDRVFGLAVFLSAALALTAAIAWGRSGFGPGSCCACRYCLLSMPGLLAGYLISDLYLSFTLRATAKMALFLLAALLLPFNYADGARQAATRADNDCGFVDDLDRGVPVPAVAQHYCHGNPATFEHQMQSLRRLGWQQFSTAAASLPTVQEQPCSAVQLLEGTSSVQSLYPDGRVLHYSLGENSYLVGVRLKYKIQNPTGKKFHLWVSWERHDVDAAYPKRSFEKSITEECLEDSMTLWLFGHVESIAVDCGPCAFTLQEVTLLLPQTK